MHYIALPELDRIEQNGTECDALYYTLCSTLSSLHITAFFLHHYLFSYLSSTHSSPLYPPLLPSLHLSPDITPPFLLPSHLHTSPPTHTHTHTSDLLQQALLVIAQKYPVLGLKLAWAMFSSIADYAEKKITQVQLAASVCLLMQLELAITGTVM